MTRLSSEHSSSTVAAVLGGLHRKGVTLWSENGELRYRAPKGTLTAGDIEGLRNFKGQIVTLLERAGIASIPAPLTYSQQCHWHRYRLGERRHLRQIVSATRLRGALQLDALRASLGEMMRRHGALRTRIIVRDGAPSQEVLSARSYEWAFEDIRSTPAHDREAELQRLIEQCVLEPVDVTTDPLFAAKLIRLDHHEHVLILAMEHIISDGYSRRILWRDLLAAYEQARQGRSFDLPPVRVPFANYALAQKSGEHAWLDEHGEYWKRRLAGCVRQRFPADEVPPSASTGWGFEPLIINQELTAALSMWRRARKTTLVMTVLTAYVAFVLRWCHSDDIVIRYQTDGRGSPDIENTIGYFAAALHLRIELGAGDTFNDLADRVREEYCRACEHADHSYIEAQQPAPDLARTTEFNWAPSRAASPAGNEMSNATDELVCTPVPFVTPLIKSLDWDAEPAVMLSEAGDQIVGRMYFPAHRFSAATMQRCSRNFLRMVSLLVSQPQMRVRDIALL